MRARDMAEDLPTVDVDSDAMEAARTLARHRIPGLVVLDDKGVPYTVLPGSQVLRFVSPDVHPGRPALAGRLRRDDGRGAVPTAGRARGARPASEAAGPDDLPVVEGDANAMEVAALMARLRSPIVAVVDDGAYAGAVTASRLLEHLILEPPE